jgi:putative endopeptidase
MATNELQAMQSRIRRVSWMSPETKAAALKKLANVEIMVGYPDHWRDYSGLTIDSGDLYGNLERSAAFEWRHHLSELGRPVDRREWEVPPQTPDAYTTYERLALVFGAGYLQAPFFDPSADLAVNYGAIGGVIGHELTHQFDDQGSGYDWTGKQHNWWTSEDAARFKKEAQKLVQQVDAYEILPGVHINGELTLGENIADLGGLLVALDAYHLALRGRPAPVIAGLTGDQRLFLAWAQMWRKKTREDVIRLRAIADVHAPERFRAIGPTRNVDSWYGTFAVKPGDHYYLPPADRVRIW